MAMHGQKIRVLFGTAETSGEHHAIMLARALQERIVKSKELELFAVGSKERLQASEPGITVPDYFDVANISSQVGLPNLLAILRWPKIFKSTRRFIRENGRPDLFVAISSYYSNIFIGKRLKKNGIKCMYYMPPQAWAWGHWRLKSIRKIFDVVLTHFPFEASFYQQDIKEVFHCGYPKPEYDRHLIDDVAISQYKERFGIPKDKKVLLLLPGSRKSEIRILLPIFLGAAKKYLNKHPDTHIHIINLPEYQEIIQKIQANRAFRDLQITTNIRENDIYSYITGMKLSSFIVCSSGTITIEAMELKTPMIICYKLTHPTHLLAWLLRIGTMFFKRIGCFGLPNIHCLAQGMKSTPPIPELLHGNLSTNTLYETMEKLFPYDDQLDNQKKWLENLNKSIFNESHYQQAVDYILDGRLEGKRSWDVENLPGNRQGQQREAILYNLSDVFDLSSYHQKEISVQINYITDNEIIVSCSSPIPLGRASLYSIKYLDVEEVEDGQEFFKVRFIMSRKIDKRYVFYGKKEPAKEVFC